MEKSKYLKRIYGIHDAVLKRKRKPTSSLDDGKTKPEFPETPYGHYRSTYIQALDNVIHCTKDWFNQPGYVMLMTTENLMLKCISKTNYDKEFQTVTYCYGNNLNNDMIRLHLETLEANIPGDVKTFKEIVTYLKSLPPSSSILLSDVFTIVKLLLVISANG